VEGKYVGANKRKTLQMVIVALTISHANTILQRGIVCYLKVLEFFKGFKFILFLIYFLNKNYFFFNFKIKAGFDL